MSAHDYAEIDARIFAHRTGAARTSMVEAAQRALHQRRERQAANRGRSAQALGPFYVEIEQVLHAAGCVDVLCTTCTVGRGVDANGRGWVRYVPGVVKVRAEGMRRRALRDDEVCEVLEAAEKALKATGEYRVGVAWTRDPPVLYVARIPVVLGTGL